MEVGARPASACGPSGSCLLSPAFQASAQQGHVKGAQSWPSSATAVPPTASNCFLCSWMSPRCLEQFLANTRQDTFPHRMLSMGVERVRLCLGVQAQSSSLVPGLACLSSPAPGSLLPTPSGLHSPCVAIPECQASRTPPAGAPPAICGFLGLDGQRGRTDPFCVA